MSITNSNLFRLNDSTPELDAAELKWWEEFADVEERFCWVQTPFFQKFLRSHYLQEIVKITSSGKLVAELGCGTGWLTILLAEMGADKVVGIDFSEAQIKKARQRVLKAGVSNKVIFQVADVPHLIDQSSQFDVIIVHGFLHHLTTSEIRQLVTNIYKILNKTGRLIIWEPVKYSSSQPTAKSQRLLNRLNWLHGIPLRGRRWGIRKLSSEEQRIRSIISKRNVGELPRGPSPKEMPFLPNELPDLLEQDFSLQRRKKCMAVSHLIAQELLLMELSRPYLAWLLRYPLLALARYFEQRLLSLDPPDPSLWVFEMFDFTPK